MKTHKYLTRQYMLSTDYEIFHYLDKDITNINLHHHDFYECYLLISGNVTYQIEGKVYDLRPMDLVLINSKELHQAIIRNEKYERIVLWINRSFLKELSTEKTDLTKCFESLERKNILRTEIDYQQNIKGIFKKLVSLEEYNGVGEDLLYKTYITELMIYINNLMFTKEINLGVNSKENILTDKVIEYINDHLEEEITIDEIAKELYISKFHLSREFKKNTGTTIHRYIVQRKLIEAKELILRRTSIKNVYKLCGFGDYSNFFRAFKTEYGVTPKEFYNLMNK